MKERTFGIGDRVHAWTYYNRGRVLRGCDGTEYAVAEAIITGSAAPSDIEEPVGIRVPISVAIPSAVPHHAAYMQTEFEATLGKPIALTGPLTMAARKQVFTLDGFVTRSVSCFLDILSISTPHLLRGLFEEAGLIAPPKRLPAPPDIPTILKACYTELCGSETQNNSQQAQVQITPNSTLHINANGWMNYTSSDPSEHDLAARASVEFLRDTGRGSINIEDASEEYGIHLWAHAQLMGLKTTTEPPRHLLPEARQLVDTLRVQYAKDGIALRPYLPRSAAASDETKYEIARRTRDRSRFTVITNSK